MSVCNTKNIMIYDLSGIISTGAFSSKRVGNFPSRKKWATKQEIIPTGGLFGFIGYLVNDMDYIINPDKTLIVCCDSKHNERKHYDPSYKKKRELRYSWDNNGIKEDEFGDLYPSDLTLEDLIDSDKNLLEKIALRASRNCQIQIAKDICEKSGIIVIERDGKEADDIILSIVNKYKSPNNYISIRTDDEDMLVSKMINPNTNLLGIMNKNINTKPIPTYFNKIVEGCTSDNVPSLKSRYLALSGSQWTEDVTDDLILLKDIVNLDYLMGLSDKWDSLSIFEKPYIDSLATEISDDFLIQAFVINTNLTYPRFHYDDISEEMLFSREPKLNREELNIALSSLEMKKHSKSLGLKYIYNGDVQYQKEIWASYTNEIVKYYLTF